MCRLPVTDVTVLYAYIPLDWVLQVYYVRVRMAIVVVRADSLLICGSRDRQQPRRPLIPDGATLGDWRIWSDR
jgi:hypothetical protein